MARKIKYGSAEFKKRCLTEAFLAVTLIECGDCGSPVLEGYCCTYCGCDSPTKGRSWVEPINMGELFDV